MPAGVEEERRQHPRFPFIEQALLKVGDESRKDKDDSKVLQCTLKDASAKGVRIHALMALAPGTRITLWLSKPGERGSVVFRGVVRWCHAAGDEPGYNAGVNLQVGRAGDVEHWKAFFPPQV